MRIAIVAVGRQKPGPMQDLERHYTKRITFPLAITEVEEKRKVSAAELKTREAELLLAAVPKTAAVIALDSRGKNFSSADFAKRLAAWQRDGVDLAFVIGGAEGLSESILDKAQLKLSLGAMTWPHLLARGMLLEQLYRAQQILAGHPYHRE